MIELIFSGFVKRASEHGVGKEKAIELFKTANAINGLRNLVRRAVNRKAMGLRPAASLGLQAGAAASVPALLAQRSTADQANQMLSQADKALSQAEKEILLAKNAPVLTKGNLNKLISEYLANLRQGDLAAIAGTAAGVGGLGLAGKGLYDLVSGDEDEKQEQAQFEPSII